MGAGAVAGAGRRSLAFVTDDLSVAAARPSVRRVPLLVFGRSKRNKVDDDEKDQSPVNMLASVKMRIFSPLQFEQR